jgi:hypothetical protein
MQLHAGAPVVHVESLLPEKRGVARTMAVGSLLKLSMFSSCLANTPAEPSSLLCVEAN